MNAIDSCRRERVISTAGFRQTQSSSIPIATQWVFKTIFAKNIVNTIARRTPWVITLAGSVDIGWARHENISILGVFSSPRTPPARATRNDARLGRAYVNLEPARAKP